MRYFPPLTLVGACHIALSLGLCGRPAAAGLFGRASAISAIRNAPNLSHLQYIQKNPVYLTMGLTIHYQGRFNDQASLSEMIEEVKNIAEVNQWVYTIFNEHFPDLPDPTQKIDNELYGMIVSLPKCEPLFLCFASNRRLANPVWLGPSSLNQAEIDDLLYFVFTKTQYAGVEAHKKIIHLLKHLSQKYFVEFEVNDEGGYWETGDELLLSEQFRKLTQILNTVATKLESLPGLPGESPDGLADRIAQKLKSNPDPEEAGA